MVQNKACPQCGSYNISKNFCRDCNSNFKELNYSFKTKNLQYPLITKKGEQKFFTIDRNGIFDGNSRICKHKFPLFRNMIANPKIITELGFLELHKEKPNIIEVKITSGEVFAQINMVEKDLFTLTYQNTTYRMDRIGSIPFNIYESDGDPIATIENNPDGYTKKFGATFPSYTLLSKGILENQVAMMLLVFVYYYRSFIYSLKPVSGESFTIKRGTGFSYKFYDSHGNFIAKTVGYNKIWWIIGFITGLFFIGIFIIIYLGYKTSSGGKIVSHNGELIGSYKVNHSRRIVECKTSRGWNGTINFDKTAFYISKNGVTGNLSGSDGNYYVKNLTIIQNEKQENLCQVFGFGNNFLIVKDDQFDAYKAYVLSIVLITRFLIPKNNTTF